VEQVGFEFGREWQLKVTDGESDDENDELVRAR